MVVYIYNLTQSGSVNRSVGELSLYAADHLLEGVDLSADVLTASLGALNAQAQLEVLFVTDQNVSNGSDLGEDIVQLLLTALPAVPGRSGPRGRR